MGLFRQTGIMPPAMHLLVPFAAPLSEHGRQAAAGLPLQHLNALLRRAGPPERLDGDEHDLSPPHERALAQAIGLEGGDGLLPWAARAAAADGVDVGTGAWALLTPVHLQAHARQVTLGDPELLALDEPASRELLDIVRPLLESEGFVLAWGAPLRWYASHESLDGLATASPDRVVGRAVEDWLPRAPQARLLRRLQNEVQMLLYTHDVSRRREAAGALPVNSFWISGCGRAQPMARVAPPVVDERLRRPALDEDWAAWAAAWQALDAGPLAALARSGGSLTLCGERAAARFEVDAGWRARLAAGWRRVDVPALLGSL